jgi:hypothetical protein
MKKVYASLAAALVTVGMMAQAPSVPANQHATKKVTTPRGVDPAGLAPKHNNNVQTTESFWLNYGEALDAGQMGYSLNQNYLCTDSTLLGNFGGDYAGIWVNNIGNILDVRSDVLENYYGYSWNGFNNFTVDSMSLMYAYSRTTASNIVDTLMVYLYYNTTTTIMPTYYFTGMSADYGADTVYFKAMPYSYTTNSPSASNKVLIKVPLTDADTAETLFRMKDFATNYAVPGGKLVASSITFKPGFSYNTGDSIGMYNSFFFASMEQFGDNTFPQYTYCPNSASLACDWNVSSIVPSDIRYNNDPSWNGFFIPTYAYTVGYGYEHHFIYYKVTTLNTEVTENTAEGLSLGQNVPNPSNGTTKIGYSIENAGSVAINVYDVTGKQVLAVNQGHQSAGSYQVELSTENLDAGVYFYTLNVDGKQATRRMVIAR